MEFITRLDPFMRFIYLEYTGHFSHVRQTDIWEFFVLMVSIQQVDLIRWCRDLRACPDVFKRWCEGICREWNIDECLSLLAGREDPYDEDAHLTQVSFIRLYNHDSMLMKAFDSIRDALFRRPRVS